jgi:hypothetical protein
MAWQRRNAPTALMGVALLASALLIFALCWDLTFFQDSWAFLLDRQGYSADVFLAPHNEHIVVLPMVINKVLLEVFGMTSGRPEMVAMTMTLLATGALLFVYVRRRVGPWLALMAAVLLLFLGSAWPILLWPFEIEFSGAVMGGLAMLLLLERDDRRGDAWACLMLIVSIGFGSLGISFAAAALVDVFLKRRSRGWSRAYVPFVPLALYVVWYLGWGHEAAHHLTLSNVLMSPQYVFDGFASALDSLAGLSSIPVEGPPEQPEWGRPLLVGLLALVAFGKWRRPGFSPRLWPVLAAGVSYWLLAAFNFLPGREAPSSRYVYAGAVFVLLIAADLLQGLRFSRRALLIFAAGMLLALGPNLAQMRAGANWLQAQSVLTRADTAAMEIARRTIAPSFGLTPELAGTSSLFIVQAGPYFEAVDEYGSPAYSVEELKAAPEAGRFWADVVLSKALPISSLTEAGATANDPDSCVTIPGGVAPGRPDVELPPGVSRIGVAPGAEANLSLRRFAVGQYPVPIDRVAGDSTTVLRIPRDTAAQPWFLHIEAGQPVWVCSA